MLFRSPAGVVRRRIERAARECARLGLTGVHDAGVGAEDIAAYRALIAEKKLPVRIYAMIGGEGPLWREYLRALRESDAEAFVMENVPQLLGSAEYEAFKTAAEDELGFTVEGRILNAADYGVPQRRRRAIVIGVRGGAVPWPERTHFDPAKTIPFGGRPWRARSRAM